jgi:putative polyhydroxyalkanoate system protein
MSDIKMIKFHSLPMAKARALVQKAAEDLAEEYSLTSEWHGNTLRFHRSGVEGQMQVSEAEIHLDVTLGFLLRPFKAKFVEHIEHNFDRLLAHAAKTAKAPAKKAARKPATKSRSGKA